jgi:hypothetical protein
MKTRVLRPTLRQQAGALVLVVILSAVLLALACAALTWSQSTSRLTARNTQYVRSMAAAEAATEKVIAHIGNDYQNYGIPLVNSKLDIYRTMVPTVTEHAAWGEFQFMDKDGMADRTTVEWLPVSAANYLSLKYEGLRGFAYDVKIISKVRERRSGFSVVGRNEQSLELAIVPVFQYAIFYNGDLEFNRCAPMTVNGPVHCNANIYGKPYESLVFKGQVTAAGKIRIKEKKPGDRQDTGSGTTTFEADYKEGVPTLRLPLGTNNTSTAALELLQVPPWTESSSSLMGQLRYYNQADLVVVVSDTGVRVSSGLVNNFYTTIPSNQVDLFLRIDRTFFDAREQKTVKTTEIDMAKFREWNRTNSYLRALLPEQEIRVLYVADQRSIANGSMTGVRLVNGAWLPPKGLTVATPNPLYIWGHYNVTTNGTPVNLGASNTTQTVPASVAADALTILSPAWDDALSSSAKSQRNASDMTANVAILVGNTETTPSTKGLFGGGVHNLPRYLEIWTGRTFTLNTSIVSMFPSARTCDNWSKDYYEPPTRNWAYDLNFNDPLKLPPATPQVRLMIRGSWAD